jgi:hypothetical protein
VAALMFGSAEVLQRLDVPLPNTLSGILVGVVLVGMNQSGRLRGGESFAERFRRW